MYAYTDKHEIGRLIKCSDSTLVRYRKKYWDEGIHWVRITRTNVRYNLELIKDWVTNRHDPAAHQRAIAEYLKARNKKGKGAA